MCNANTFSEKQHHCGHPQHQKPKLEITRIATALKNSSSVGLKSPGGLKNSFGTVSGRPASDIFVKTP
jgi:hypothetical protein